MSISEKLSAAGYDLDEIKAAKRSHHQRAVEIVAVETSEGDVFGLSYACDFRAEEEWGVGDLSRAFASRASKKAASHRILAADLKAGTAEESGPRGGGLGAPGNQMDLVTVLDDVVSLRTVEISGSLEDTWSTAKDEARQIESARGSIRDSRGYITGVPEAWRLERELFRDLRGRARAAGIEKPGRSKAAVIQQIVDAAVPEHPYTEPADFHDGRHLVIPRRGAVGVVLEGLVEAARDGFLLAGGSLGNPFGSGFLLLDERDIPRADRDEAEATAAWHREQMVPVKKVEKHLRSVGTSVYFIGRPRQGEDGEVRYSVNLSHRGIGQFWGQFTLEEMLADGFAEREAAAYRARRDA